jgi:hypothetical protein
VPTIVTKKEEEEEGGEKKEEKEKETSWGGGSGESRILITITGSSSSLLNLQGLGTNEGLCAMGEAQDKKGQGGPNFYFSFKKKFPYLGLKFNTNPNLLTFLFLFFCLFIHLKYFIQILDDSSI